MSNLKQFVIVAVASIAIFASVNHYPSKSIEFDPVSLESLVIDCEGIIEKPKGVSIVVDLNKVYEEIISSDTYQIEHTKSMTLDDNYIELVVSSTEFNNITGDCHVSIINDTYNAEAWYNIDSCSGYLAAESTVSGSSVQWVPITDKQSTIVDTLFYSVKNDTLLNTIRALFEEIDCYDTLLVDSTNKWKVTRHCTSGDTTVMRSDNCIKIIVDNPVGTDSSVYTIRLNSTDTSVPGVCTELTSSITDLNNVYSEIKEF